MNVFDTARGELAGKLAAAGLATTLDPAALPPVVLVDNIAQPVPAGVGGVRGHVAVKIIAAPPGDLAANTWINDQLELVWRTLGFGTWTYTTVTVGGKDCPACTVSYPLDITNPDC